MIFKSRVVLRITRPKLFRHYQWDTLASRSTLSLPSIPQWPGTQTKRTLLKIDNDFSAFISGINSGQRKRVAHFNDDDDDDLWELAESHKDLFPSRRRAKPLTDYPSFLKPGITPSYVAQGQVAPKKQTIGNSCGRTFTGWMPCLPPNQQQETKSTQLPSYLGQLNSAFHPSVVGKSSTGLSGGALKHLLKCFANIFANVLAWNICKTFLDVLIRKIKHDSIFANVSFYI